MSSLPAPPRARLHDPPPRIPETALRDAVASAAALTKTDGRDRYVLFDAARRRLSVAEWPLDERPWLAVIATIEPDPDAA